MKKSGIRALALLLCLLMALTFVPVTTAEAAGENGSGGLEFPKLTKGEIVELLKENPEYTPDDPFEVEPSVRAPYSQGKLTAEALQYAVDRLSALRRIAGLPAVEASWDLSDNAQYGAVLLASGVSFGHYPPKPSDMSQDFYDKGREATSSSNIYSGPALTSTVDGFMDDPGSTNLPMLGHRRWQLNPTMGKVGFGYAVNTSSRYTCEKVFDRSGSGCDYDYIAWPASGYFPVNLFEGNTGRYNVAWSVTLNPEKYEEPDLSDITVKLTRRSDGAVWTLSGNRTYTARDEGEYLNVDLASYGVPNVIVFRPNNNRAKYEGVYTVEITGLRSVGGGSTSLKYDVEFFDVDTYVDETPHAITVAASTHGSVTANATKASAGTQVTLSVAPEEGYKLSSLYVTGGSGATVPVSWLNDTTAVFVMPAESVTVSYTFAKWLPFVDVPSGDWCFEYVWYAYNHDLVRGIDPTHFSPYTPANRAMVASLIWRLAGSPTPSGESPFVDILPGQYYTDAVNWAYENGIIFGINDTHFDPFSPVNREQLVAMLYRYYDPAEGYGDGVLEAFTDEDIVDPWAWEAMKWAVSNEIMAGRDSGAIDPWGKTMRAELATFFTRCDQNL